MINTETLKELEKVSEKERKSTRLVEELEEQLNQNWDQHEAANNRLSALQTERTRELQDAIVHGESLHKEVEDSRIKIALLEVSNFNSTLDIRTNANLYSLNSWMQSATPPAALPSILGKIFTDPTQTTRLRARVQHTTLYHPHHLLFLFLLCHLAVPLLRPMVHRLQPPATRVRTLLMLNWSRTRKLAFAPLRSTCLPRSS
jgi:hypothetical protein